MTDQGVPTQELCSLGFQENQQKLDVSSIPTKICRLCGNVADKTIDIFSQEKGKDLSEKMHLCLTLEVSESDKLPKQLCSLCFEKLEKCFDFSTSCITAKQELETNENNFAVSGPSKKTGETLTHDQYSCPLCWNGKMLMLDQQKQADTIDRELQEVCAGVYKVHEGEQILKITSELEQSKNSSKSMKDKPMENPSVILLRSIKYSQKTNNLNNTIEDVNPNVSFKYYDGSLKNLKNITGLKYDPELSNQNENNGELQGITQVVHDAEDCNAFLCRFCGRSFSSRESLYHHSQFHAAENLVPCLLCDNVSYFTNSELEEHFLRHFTGAYNQVSTIAAGNTEEISEPALRWMCGICNETFATEETFVEHGQIHEGPQISEECTVYAMEACSAAQVFVQSSEGSHRGKDRHVCEYCGKSVTSENALKLHIVSTHADSKPFQCEFCGVAFSQLPQLNKHTKRFHVEKTLNDPTVCYKCSVCKIVYCELADILLHLPIHPKATLRSLEVFALVRCEFCDLCFENRQDLSEHTAALHGGGKPYVCLSCNEHFESYYKVSEHRKSEHPLPPPYPITTYYACEFCLKQFKQWEHLYIHRYKSHVYVPPSQEDGTRVEKVSVETHQCDICKKVFESQPGMLKHRRQSHPHGSKYKCADCGKVLANLTGLTIHRRLHTGERPFACDVCGKTFHQSSGLYTHRRVHTRDCPYTCEFCGKAYNVKGDLDNHRRAKHTKERPFKCTVCNKAFLTSSVFYQHRVLHTGVRKYKCNFCNKSFARWNALRLHIRTHTGEKPHVCSVCNRGFAQKGDMRKHMRTQHTAPDMNHEMTDSFLYFGD